MRTVSRRAGSLAVLAGLGLLPPPAAAQAPGGPETDVGTFLPALRQAWASGDVAQVLPLFAPGAVVQLDYREPGGPLAFQGEGPGTMTLRDGVAVLLAGEAQPDPVAPQAVPVVVGGAPATAVRWAYRRPSLIPVPAQLVPQAPGRLGVELHLHGQAPSGR